MKHTHAILGASLIALVLLSGPVIAEGSPAPFTEEALARGLDFTMGPFPQVQGYLGQGGGFADLDSDGDPDIILLGAADGTVGVFENIGGGYFIDRSATSGMPTLEQQEGFSAADFDADGLLDIYLTQQAKRNFLMRNLGGFVFEDVTNVTGTYDEGPGTGTSWGDFDGDGWLDLYVCNYSAFEPFNRNVFYRNDAGGSFTDEGPLYEVNSGALSFQSVWSDYDKDGDLDLYVSNDRGPLGYPPNQLYMNDNGHMVDVSASSGADVSLFSMGLAAGDFDGNLYPDYYVTNVFSATYPGINMLILNQGDGTFVESAEVTGTANYITSWGAIFFDYDNDGHKDLYVNNMWVPNSFFVNDGTFPTVEMAAALGIGASYDPGYDPEGTPPASIASFSSAIADVDGDGDLDLLVNNVGSRAELFINHEGSTRSWVRYKVVGEHPNLFAVGANIHTTANGVRQFDESYAGANGYLGQNELVIHVGLGDATIVEQAVVDWPSSESLRTLTNLPVGQEWTIYPPGRLCDVEGDAAVAYSDFLAFVGCFASDFVPGCEMMDFNGDSEIYVDDLAQCFIESSTDCNGNGTEDLVEIMLDLGLDGDQDGQIDCCSGGSTPYPNSVGPSLRLDRVAANVGLSWTAPGSDATHDSVDSYDIYGSTAGPATSFDLLANVTGTTHTESLGADAIVFYVVGARNGCGSSGEEPF